MLPVVRLVSIIFIRLFIISTDTYVSTEKNQELIKGNTSGDLIKNPKEIAFQILDNKCNVCHHKRNKRSVFTLENMNTRSNDIYKQVFIKRRIPKGNKIKLTNDDHQALLTWISCIKYIQNGN